MDYLRQAKTFIHRANDAQSDGEKIAHLNMAVQMLLKIIENNGLKVDFNNTDDRQEN